MRSTTQIVWDTVGRPSPAQRAVAERASICALCAGDECPQWAPLETGLSDAFSDFRDMRCPSSADLCAACVWVMQGKPPATFRMWSVLFRADGKTPPSKEGAPFAGEGLHLTNKGGMEHVLEALLVPPPCPWFVCVADSGQIHTVPFAVMQLPGASTWSVRFERGTVYGSPALLRETLWRVTSLISAGFSKGDVETLEPSVFAMKKGLDAWREHAHHLVHLRTSRLLDLAMVLIRKDTIDEVRRRTEPPGYTPRPRDDAQRIDRPHLPDGLVVESEKRAEGRGGQQQLFLSDGVPHGGEAPNRRAPKGKRGAGSRTR